MEENIENPSDYGIYIVDRRMKSVEESIQQLADIMLGFCQKSRRQRINQRNRTERLSDILDWKRMGLEYVKARHLALRRRYPDSFTRRQRREDNASPDEESWDELEEDDEEEEDILESLENGNKIRKPFSAPSSPKIRALIEETDENMQRLMTGGDSPFEPSPVHASQPSSADIETPETRERAIAETEVALKSLNIGKQPN